MDIPGGSDPLVKDPRIGPGAAAGGQRLLIGAYRQATVVGAGGDDRLSVGCAQDKGRKDENPEEPSPPACHSPCAAARVKHTNFLVIQDFHLAHGFHRAYHRQPTADLGMAAFLERGLALTSPKLRDPYAPLPKGHVRPTLPITGRGSHAGLPEAHRRSNVARSTSAGTCWTI